MTKFVVSTGRGYLFSIAPLGFTRDVLNAYEWESETAARRWVLYNGWFGHCRVLPVATA